MTRRVRLIVLAFGGAGLAALLVAACFCLPGFGGDLHPYGDRVVRASSPGTPRTRSLPSTSTSAPSTPSAK